MPQVPVINLDDVPDVNFSPIPKGEYSAIVEAVLYKISDPARGGSGHPYLNFTWVISGPSYAGRKVFQTCSLQKQSLWVLKSTLKGLNLPHSGQLQISYDEVSGVVTVPSCVGIPATLQISITTDGKYNSVDGVLPIDSQGSAPSSPASSAPALVVPTSAKGLK